MATSAHSLLGLQYNVEILEMPSSTLPGILVGKGVLVGKEVRNDVLH